MATSEFPAQTDPGIGGGGSGWERNIHNQDVSSATPVYNQTTGQWEWRMPDGSLLGSGRQNSYDNGMGGTSTVGVMQNPTNGGSFAPYAGSDPSGGGSGVPLGAIAKAAAPVVATAVGRAAGGSGAAGSGQIPPELQQLLALAMKRMSQQQPLFEAINAQAMAGLPTAYQKG